MFPIALRGPAIGYQVTLPTILLALVVSVCSQIAMSAPAQQNPAVANAELFARLDADQDGLLRAAELPAGRRSLFERLLRKADTNRDNALTPSEFSAGLASSQPEKPIEEKQPSEHPGADAIRWLLLSMDANRDSSLTAEEVPQRFRSAWSQLLAQNDRDGNGRIDLNELSQGRPITNIAQQTAQQQGVDVSAELARLQTGQGAAFDRFDSRRGGPQMIGINTPRLSFPQLDATQDGQLELAEVPTGARGTFQELLQVADRDRNGKLNEAEFLAGSRQMGNRRGPRGRRGGPLPRIDAMPGADQANPSRTPGTGSMDAAEPEAMNAPPGAVPPPRRGERG